MPGYHWEPMFARLPILRYLLAILLAVSPSVCTCLPPQVEGPSSCCTGKSEADAHSCCGEHEGNTDAPAGGCNDCEGGCQCKQTSAFKAEAPTTPNFTALVALPVVDIGFAPYPDFRAAFVVSRVESRAVPKPPTTLLRQHCALTI